MSNSSETKVIDSFEKKSFTDKIISEIKDFDIIETISSPRLNSNNFSSILDKKMDENVNDVVSTVSDVLTNNDTVKNEPKLPENDGLTISEKISDIISDNLRDNESNNINIVANYLPKRKVREMLFAKYKIDNDEYVNEIYNMAFNRKWKEMDLEQWLSNPNNINRLFGSIKSQMNLKDKELAQKRRGLIQDQHNRESSSEDKSKNNSKQKSDMDEDGYSYVKNNNQLYGPFRKEIMAHNLMNDKHLLNCVDLGFVRDGIYANKMDNKILEVKLDNLKNEMKYAYIEEKLKENQIDLQTEKLKNHIDNKFGEFFKTYSYDNQWQKNNSKGNDDKFDRYRNYPGINNSIIEELKEDIFSKISLLDEKISSIEIDYKKNADSLSTNSGEIIDKVSSQIKFAFEEFDKRESLINEQLEETNEKIDEANEKIENTVGSIDEKISNAINQINSLNQNLSKELNIENQKIKSSLSNLSNQINATSKNVIAFANDLENLKTFVYDKDNFNGSSNISESLAANIMDQINESNKQMNKISDELNELKSLVNGENFDNKINDVLEKNINEKLNNANEEIFKLRDDFNNLLKDNNPKTNESDGVIFLGGSNNQNNPTFENYLKDNNSSGGFHKNKFVDDTKFDNNGNHSQFKNEAPILIQSKQDELPNFDEIDTLIKQSIEQIKSLNEVVQLDAKENDQVEIQDSINKLESIKEDKNQ